MRKTVDTVITDIPVQRLSPDLPLQPEKEKAKRSIDTVKDRRDTRLDAEQDKKRGARNQKHRVITKKKSLILLHKRFNRA